MMKPESASDHAFHGEQAFADLVEEITRAIEASEPVDLARYEEEHPEYVERLRRLVPALQVLEDIGLSAVRSTCSSRSLKPPATSLKGILGDFRILREIGRGGMGVVYEVEQISLGRRMALKVLPFAGVLDERQLTRFRNEARAAASLDHPNIVQVHSVGCERGVHYYAMQYVEGKTLAEVIAEMREKQAAAGGVQPAGEEAAQTSPCPAAGEGPEVRPGRTESSPREAPTAEETLPGAHAEASTQTPAGGKEFFRQVANWGIQAAEGLEHAHQLGIVHRDIKPSNLLVDDHGHLWITDFGLAQIETDASVTMTGDVLGTVRYMSPEQATGRSRVLDCRTDIYSLGVTLYESLALEPPFAARDRHTLIHQIIDGDPCSLRQINRSIPRDLETIVLKTAAKEPSHRYPSAQELADDLRRFLNDEPVRARPPSKVERARKWAWCHRSIVATAAATLAIAVIVAGGLVWQERNRTLAALALESEQRGVAQEKAKTEAAARQEADRQRRLADENFRRAKVAVDTYLTKVSENELLDEPGLQPLRKDLLELALKYYQEFIEEQGEDPTLLAELAAAHLRVAGIQKSIGSMEKARQAYEQAVAIGRRVVAISPEGLEHHSTLANYLQNLGVSQAETGQTDEARSSFLEALDIQRRTVQMEVAAVDERRRLASILGSLGVLENTMGNRAQAIACLQESLAVLRQLGQERPDNTAFQGQLGFGLTQLADIQTEVGDRNSAMSSLQEAIDVRNRLIEREPDVLNHRRLLADCYSSFGPKRQSVREQIEWLEKAIEIRDKLATENPLVHKYRFDLANSLVTVSTRHARIGDAGKALGCLEKGHLLLQKLAEDNPTVAVYQSGLAAVLWKLGDMTPENEEKQDEKLAYYHKCIALLENLATTNPSVPDYTYQVSCRYNDLGNCHTRYGRADEARECYEKTAAVARQLCDDYPASHEYWRALAGCYVNIGNVHRDAHERLQWYEKAVPLYEEAIKLAPQNTEYLFGSLGNVLVNICGVHEDLGDLQKAIETARRIVAIRQRAIDVVRGRLLEEVGEITDDPSYRGYAIVLVASLEHLAELLSQVGQTEEALTHEQKAVDLSKELLDLAPDSPERREYCSSTLADLGRLLAAAGRVEEADQVWTEAVDLWKGLVDEDVDEAAAEEQRTVQGGALLSRAYVLRMRLDGQDDLEPVLELIRRSVKLEPNWGRTWDVWHEVCVAHYPSRNWEGAEVDARLAISLYRGGAGPTRFIFHMAPLLLLAGKTEEYKLFCRRLIEQLPAAPFPDHASWVAQMCVLTKDAAGSPQEVIRVAELAVPGGEQYHLYSLGMAYCRAGEYEKAIVWLTKVIERPRDASAPMRAAVAMLGLAIAHHHLGQTDEANLWFTRAMEVVAQDPTLKRPYAHTRMEILVLRAEASELLGLTEGMESQTGEPQGER